MPTIIIVHAILHSWRLHWARPVASASIVLLLALQRPVVLLASLPYQRVRPLLAVVSSYHFVDFSEYIKNYFNMIPPAATPPPMPFRCRFAAVSPAHESTPLYMVSTSTSCISCNNCWVRRKITPPPPPQPCKAQRELAKKRHTFCSGSRVMVNHYLVCVTPPPKNKIVQPLSPLSVLLSLLKSPRPLSQNVPSSHPSQSYPSSCSANLPLISSPLHLYGSPWRVLHLHVIQLCQLQTLMIVLSPTYLVQRSPVSFSLFF